MITPNYNCFFSGFFLDVAFLISNHFKKERRGKNNTENENDVLYNELGGAQRLS